ncbi:hypothetical protein AVEN_89839-1 [Araneus ventricosus]|uniref:Uncharacterized protein n=1 Tax=Araneus ventricosus TaxID=182803 RepID=A0A4Y2TAJ8_ARAVE|nr:hypothetical protein AVEN_89839-1 [Araneus ventricosus]
MTARVRKKARVAGRGLDTASEENGHHEETAKNRLCGRTLRKNVVQLGYTSLFNTYRTKHIKFRDNLAGDERPQLQKTQEVESEALMLLSIDSPKY